MKKNPSSFLKYLLMAVGTVVLFTGCHSPNSGSPGDSTYTEGSNDRRTQKSGINLREGWNH